MYLEFEGMQVGNKLGQEFDKSNDQNLEYVILPRENHSQEMIELRTYEDNFQEQGNHEPKKEIEIENLRDGFQGREIFFLKIN